MRLTIIRKLALLGLCAIGACGPEPTAPSKTSIAGTWTATNARLFSLSNFRLELIQEPEGLVSGLWFARGDGGGGGCDVGVPCDAYGFLTGRNTVSQVELELLGAGKFEGGLLKLKKMRGIFAVGEDYDTITFVKSTPAASMVIR